MTRSEWRALLFEPIRPSFLRAVAAFVAAPLAGTLVLWLLIFAGYGRLASTGLAETLGLLLVTGSLLAGIILPGAFFFAVPAYIVLWHIGSLHCASIHVSAMLAGGLLGALWGFVFETSSAGLGSIGAFCGLVAGFVFYRIISGPRRAALPRPRSEASRA